MDPRQRGLLLLVFANHELLALELMALALLKFPEAPSGWRAGLAATLVEEQRHLKRYVERARALGVELGESPLSAFFWDCLADVGDPRAFIAGMNLTLEQANLDHALHYAARCRAVGDVETEELLREVYREEVGHVKHGVVWFDRLRTGTGRAWDDYLRWVPAPLSPARAKGVGVFDRAGRLAAGLSPAFVDDVELFARSKGRPPTVYAFDATVDDALADTQPAARPPNARVRDLHDDLAPTLLWLAGPDDVVLAPRPRADYLRSLLRAGVRLPEFVDRSGLCGRTLGALEPWGWGGAVGEELAGLGGPRHGLGRAALRRLNEKTTSAEWLRELLPELEDEVPEEVVGVVCRDEAATRARVAALGAWPWVALKAPLGASGRGIRRVRRDEGWTPNLAGWVQRVLARQGALVVEPWLPRLADLSVHGDVEDDGLRGTPKVIRARVDARGQPRGHVLGDPRAGWAPALHRAWPRWRDTLREVARGVAARLHAAGYRGPFGVDALVWDAPEGPRLKPLVEVNPRWTMGRIALQLERRLRPGRVGVWTWLAPRDVPGGALGALDLPDLVVEQGRWVGGTLPTNDPAAARERLGVVSVGRTLDEAFASLPTGHQEEGP